MLRKWMLVLGLLFLIVPLTLFVRNEYYDWRYGGSPFGSNDGILKVDISKYLDSPIALLEHSGPFWVDGKTLFIDLEMLREKELSFDTIDFYPRNTVGGNATYNNDGIRAIKDYLIGEVNTIRIILLGDSFVWGSMLNDNETSSFYLQQYLDPSEQKIEVINLGAYGLNTYLEVERLYRKGLKYGPRIVILFYFNNDYLDGEVDYRLYAALEKFSTDKSFHGEYSLREFLIKLGFSLDELLYVENDVFDAYYAYHYFRISFGKFVETPLSRLHKISLDNSFKVILVAFPSPIEQISRLKAIARKYSWDFIPLDAAIGYNYMGIWSVPDGHSSAFANMKIASYLTDLIIKEKYINLSK